MYYRNEIAPTVDSESEKTQDKQYYFIVKKRPFVGREIRASRSRVGQQYKYQIRSHSDPDWEEWLSEKQLAKLNNEKLLSNFDIGSEQKL